MVVSYLLRHLVLTAAAPLTNADTSVEMIVGRK
jgi:hypothetical protein